MEFEEFLAQKKPVAPESMTIEGAFGCQQCFEESGSAEYFAMEQYLRWECAKGHISFIEDWTL